MSEQMELIAVLRENCGMYSTSVWSEMEPQEQPKACEEVREKDSSLGVRLTHAAVIYGGIINPALRLLNLSFQVHGCLCRPAVRHSFVGLGLQVLQSCCNLFSQSSGLRSVTFTPIR